MTHFNHVPLDPNCPSEDTVCWQCPEEATCIFSQSRLSYERLLEFVEVA